MTEKRLFFNNSLLGMKALTILAMVFLLVSCGGGEKPKTDDSKTDDSTAESTDDSSETGEKPTLNHAEIVKTMNSIPNPVELSHLLKKSQAVYKRTDLAGTDYINDYTTRCKQALVLGIYGADLGYANIFGKTQDVNTYLSGIQKLSQELGIEKHFDYDMIRSLSANADSLDKLLQVTNTNFEKVTIDLSEHKQEHLSVLLLTGGWLEAAYLTSLVYKEKGTEELKKALAEQKIVLHEIKALITYYKIKPCFSDLEDDFNTLEEFYSKVKVVTEEKGTRLVEKDGQLVYEGLSEQHIEATDEDMAHIVSQIASIRQKVIDQK